ncbi:MAG: hypothetical protein ABIH46_13285, partial [Chloroflexota bacterium]
SVEPREGSEVTWGFLFATEPEQPKCQARSIDSGSDGSPQPSSDKGVYAMPATTIEVKNYAYSLFSTREDDPNLVLYDAGGTLVGSLHFVSGSDPLPAAQSVGSVYHLY